MIEFLDVSELPEPEAVWSDLVASCPNAWVWTTWSVHRFRIEYLVSAGVAFQDRSFVVMKDSAPVGLASLVLISTVVGGRERKEAGYLGAPLPWPCARPGMEGLEQLLLDEVERRARESGADKIRLVLAPPRDEASHRSAFERSARERKFVELNYQSYLVSLDPEFFSRIRPKYRQSIRKFQDGYDLTVVSGRDLPAGLVQDYMELHVKDSGGQYRSYATYEKQFDVIRSGGGFCVTAFHKGAGRIVGMLMIWFLKGAAYDASVAVDPEFQHEPVSNLLKWRGSEALIERGIASYELGEVSDSPSYLQQPSDKNYGISFFKEGWSRGGRKTVYVAEKYYSRERLASDWDEKLQSLLAYFEI